MWARDSFPWSPGSISGTHEQAKPGDKRLWSDPYHSGSDNGCLCSHSLCLQLRPPTQRTSSHRPYGSSSTRRETPARPSRQCRRLPERVKAAQTP